MKSLQVWYRELNGIYLDRNFYRSAESIFAHLVEVSRGLSVAASTRRKRDLSAEEYLPKSIACSMTRSEMSSSEPGPAVNTPRPSLASKTPPVSCPGRYLELQLTQHEDSG